MSPIDVSALQAPGGLPGGKAFLRLADALFTAGEKAEARKAYQRALLESPDDPETLVSFARLLIEEKELEAARTHLEHALEVDPACRAAHAGLCFVLLDLGDPERARFHRRTAFQSRCVVPGLYRGAKPPVVVLKLISTSGGNVRTEGLLSDCVFQTHLVATDFYDETTRLPAHHLVVNCVGDADITGAALAGARLLLNRTSAPVINLPAAVEATGRCEIARRLSGLRDVVTPRIELFSRELLAARDAASELIGRGFRFPLLLRTPGFHGGEHFLKVDAAHELSGALAQLPGDEIYAIELLDARGADGKTRKYRVMMVDGELYPLHAAIAKQWKIHYFSADMAEQPEHRAEDAAFLSDIGGVLGARALAALLNIQATLGLDYGGIDFGLNREGEVLVFEANATMAIFPPAEDPRWDYRRPAVERVLRAVREMLLLRAGRPELLPGAALRAAS